MVNRLIKPSNNNSFFLFGPRGSGKSTWLKSWMSEKKSLEFNLLDPELENRFLSRPQDFRDVIEREVAQNKIEWVVIDEVQKCAELLNYAHLFIEKYKLKFALSGSSARRLKQKGTNLLAGRAFVEKLFPFTFLELGTDFSLNDSLRWGMLPKISTLNSDDSKRDYLRAYSLNYIQLEIQAEQWVRELTPFRKFLPIAAQMNGKILNLSKIAKDLGVDWTTVRNYFDILEDTFIGFKLETFDESIRKRQMKGSKFYFNDIGVKRAIEGSLESVPTPSTSYYGELFEQFVVTEIYKLNEMLKKDFKLSYLRTKDDAEIDLILEKHAEPIRLIEIKSTEKVSDEHVRSLLRFKKDFKKSECYILSRDPLERVVEGIQILHWQKGIQEIGLSGF